MTQQIISVLRAMWGKTATRKQAALLKDVLYFRKGRLMRGHEDVKSNWSCEGSVGWSKGFRPKLLHLSLTNEFTKSELISLLGEDIVTKGGRWLRSRKSPAGVMYKIIPGPTIPSAVKSILWERVKAETGVKEVDLLPSHPAWIYEKGLGINFLIRKPKTPSFKDVYGARRDIFYRAGKDLWKVPLFVRKLRVLVVKSMPNHEDGNMWLKSANYSMHLVRAALNYTGQELMLKGRAVGVQVLPLGQQWPEGDYDVMCSQHNIKWGEIPAGTILETEVQFVTDELHEDVLEGDEKRKLTLLTLLLAKVSPAAQSWLEGLFRRNAMKVAKAVATYAVGSIKDMMRLFDGQTNSLINIDQGMKVRMGFISAPEKLDKIRQSMLNRLRSVKAPGKWLAAIARMDVPVGHIVMSHYDRHDMLVNFVTVIRYPVTSYQSFITLKVIWADIPKGMVFINGNDAKYLALDGDDHVLVTKPFSSFRGGEPVLSERANAVKLELNSLSFMELYTSGADAQQLIGFCFNAMAKAIGYSEYAKSLQAIEDSEHARSLSERLGMLLDMLAQAIKKPYSLDMEALEQASSIGLETSQHPIACAAIKQDLDEVARYVWGVTIPNILPVPVFNHGLVSIPEDIMKIISKGATSVSASLNNRQIFKASSALAYELKNWVKTQPNLEEAAMTYYTVAVRVTEGSITPFDSSLVELMDGTILYLGRTLCEQRYSPLFE